MAYAAQKTSFLVGRVGWGLLNAAQLAFLAVFSVVWMTIAILACVITRGPALSLIMGRHIWSPGLLWASGARLDIRGRERVDFSRPSVFVVNHQSMADIPVFFVAVPVNLHFLAKKELFSVPFLGWYMTVSGMIPIDRSRGSAAIELLKKNAARVRHGHNVLAFAEGTRSRTGRIAPFKKGAFVLAIEAQVPVVPIAVEGARDVLPSDGFSVRPGTIRVAFGDPIPTVGLTEADREDLMKRAHDAVVQLSLSIGGRGAEPTRVDVPAPEAITERLRQSA
jgi:1-acyl-sn-glycerol-3-phosphate acyltransferase